MDCPAFFIYFILFFHSRRGPKPWETNQTSPPQNASEDGWEESAPQPSYQAPRREFNRDNNRDSYRDNNRDNRDNNRDNRDNNRDNFRDNRDRYVPNVFISLVVNSIMIKLISGRFSEFNNFSIWNVKRQIVPFKST